MDRLGPTKLAKILGKVGQDGLSSQSNGIKYHTAGLGIPSGELRAQKWSLCTTNLSERFLLERGLKVFSTEHQESAKL